MTTGATANRQAGAPLSLKSSKYLLTLLDTMVVLLFALDLFCYLLLFINKHSTCHLILLSCRLRVTMRHVFHALWREEEGLLHGLALGEQVDIDVRLIAGHKQ